MSKEQVDLFAPDTCDRTTNNQKPHLYGRRLLDREQAKVVGNNLRTARRISGKTTKEVMRAVWNSDESSTNLNRISEIENGQPASYSVLVELCKLYGCSLDYIFGLSPEYEMDLAAAKTGLIITSMREMGLDIGDAIATALVKLTEILPRSEAQFLLDASKKVVFEFQRCKHDLVFIERYSDYFDAHAELAKQTVEFDKRMARHLRIVDMTANQALERAEDETHRLALERKKYPLPESVHNADS